MINNGRLSRNASTGFMALILLVAAGAVADRASGEDRKVSEPSVAMIRAPGGEVESWPRWRGPSGQGRVQGDRYPDTWSDTENLLWRVEVPGSGNSSPIVWGDRVFLTTAYEGGKKRSVLCFRRSDGKLLWETFAPDAQPERAHPKNGNASSTPSTEGERVYAYFGNHGLMAVDFEGRLVWHRGLGKFEAFHGTASSPLLHRDRLILVQDHGGESGSFIAAFDKKTGREIWRTKRTARVGWSSPVSVRVADHDEIILSGQQQVEAYDPQTGKNLWTARGNTFETVPTPAVGHGLVFCSSGRAGPTLAIRPGGSGDVTETHVVWKASKGSPFVPSPVLYGDYLYMVNDMVSIATCYEARTGKLMWQGRLGKAQREGFTSSPVAVGGKIFFTNDAGETFVVNAGREFELLHVNRLNEQVLASPALVDGKWYFRTARHLLAIGEQPATPADEDEEETR